MGWFETMQNGSYLALCAAFDMQPGSTESYARFVPAYLPNATTPQAQRDADVCYYSPSIRQGASVDYIMQEVENSVLTVKKTIPCTVLFTFYGPHADDDAEHFWSAIWVDHGLDSPRAILRNMRIVPEGLPARPVWMYENEGTYQRRRCDVRADFSYLEIETRPVQTIASPPEIEVTLND